MGRRRERRRPGFQFAGEPDQIPAHPLVNRLETPAFRRCEICGQGQLAEFLDRLGDLFQAMFEIGEARRNRR